MKRAVGRGLCAAAFLGIALLAAFAAAPAAAQDSCTSCLNRPVVTSTPASGTTYYPGETIVVQVRPRISPWVSITSADSPTLVLRVGSSDKTLSGSLQSRQYTYSVYDHEQRQNVIRSRDTNVLEFRYTVVKGDRDTDGVSVAANALGGGNIGANVGGSQHGGGTWRPNISKDHSAMSDQSDHKVDTPAPSWSGVTGPDIIFYAGGSVSYRLPQVANADEAHNVSYSVTSARSLPTGYTLNATTATITGSYASALARNSYTLRATDGFSRTADLTFYLQVSADAGIESISITSNPGADKTYGKVAPFGTNDTITVRVDLTHRLTTVLPASVCLNIRIGSTNRQQCNPSYSTSDSSRWDKLDFSYAVQASDWDGDGISFPTNPMGAGKIGGLRFRLTGGGTDNRVNRNFASIPDDANHKVRGEQTMPSFGSTASPVYSWAKDNAVSQALPAVPAATDGDGGVTYSIEESLPAGLSFAAATRTISGTPTAAQAAANYTLAATDADGDKATLRFSIEIQGIMVSIDSPSVTEGDSGSKNLTFTATLSRDSTQQVTVDYADAGTGTATSGTDYTAITGGTLTFTAGTTSQTFDVSVTGDTTDEVDETILVTLSNASGATISTATGTGTITDNDDPPTVSVAAASVTEGDSGSKNLTFTATLSAASGKQATVNWAEGTGGTATSGTDYTAITGGTLTFAAGTTSQTFNVSVTGDVVDESNETVVVTLSSPTNATLSSTAASATGTITDNDATPTSITLTVNDDSVGEGDGDTTITVTATVDGTTRFGVDKTVTVSVAGSGTASAVDFAAVSDFDITIAAGAASKSETFTLSPADDSVDETDETITVSGTSTGLTINSDTITLSDDDDTPSITLSVDDDDVAEDDGATTITVTATVDGATRFVDDTTVEVSVAGSGTASAVDFAAVSSFNISISAGDASGTETFTLTPTNDTVHEANETITVSGTSGALTVNSATITLTDDAALPTAALSLSPTSIGEAGGASTVTATLSAESSAAVTLTVGAAAGTGAVAADFALSTAKTLTIAAGATTSTGTVTVTAADNDVDAANKSVTVSATATGGNGVAAPSSVTLTLTDDDTAGITFNPATLTLTEQGPSQKFTMVLDSEPTGLVYVRFHPDPGISVKGAVAPDTYYWGSLDSSNWDTGITERELTVAALADSNKQDETRYVKYSMSGYGSFDAPFSNPKNAVTVTVVDDDKPAVSLSLSSSISENGGTATVTATLDVAATVATTVTVAAAAGTDTDASDFTLSSANTLTIAAGETTSTGTVTIAAVDNALDEPDKSVSVSGAVSHDGVTPPTAKTLTITDDDPAPMLSIDSPSVTEGNSGSRNLTFTATLSAASGRQVTVGYADAGTGTATSGTDYTAIAAGTLTFAAGTTSQTFNVSVTGDALDEADETVKVRLKDPTNAAVSTTAGTGTGTITDDDATPTLSISSPSVAEGDSGSTPLTYTATLSAASGRQVTVQYADSGLGTATSGTDYTAITAGTLTFAAGTTSRTFSVSVTGDTVAESDETVEVTWSNAANATITSRSGVVATALRVDGTITDDDGAPSTITLTVDDDDVGEGDGATTITVTATVDGTTRFAEAKTVSVSVSQSGTSGNVVDFAAVSSFDITIPAGAASGAATFTLTPTDDTEDELDETITVSGTSTGLTVNPATISLTDDDGTPTSITLTVNDDSVGEGDGATTITVTATLDGTTTLGSAATVRANVAGSGTATAVDFDTVAAFDITIAAGDASGTANFTLTPTNDVVDETDETITVRGTSAGLTVNSATISLTDNDAAPTAITLTVDDSSVGEGDGATSITVTATVDGTTRFAEAKTVRVSVAGSGAAGAVDFAAVEAFDIEIAAGAASDTAGFTLTPTDDAVDETDETITVSGTSGSLTVNSATIALTDDDGAPTSITLTVDDSSVGEGDGAATITVTATVDGTMRFAEDTTVAVSVAGSGTATAVDFAAVTDFDITIAAGAASKTGSFTLTPTDDAVDETDETVTVSGTSGSLTVNSATIALTDNDAAPTAITLTASDDSVSEGDGATTITVTATVDGTTRFAAATTVSVLVRSDSGTRNAVDFAAVPSFDITIPAGAASGSETFTLTPTNDAVDENDETITVYGASGSLTVSPATIALTDDDATPTAITLTVSDNSVAEDDGATTITVTATVDGGTRFATATTVTASVAGTGTAGAVDFAAVTDFDIEIDARDASGTGTFTLTPTNDAFDETNETITVSGSSGSLTVNSATIALTDDDDAPTAITLTVDDASVAEDDGGTTITVTATVDGASRFVDATTVTVSVAGSGTATAVDFAAVTDFDITIAAGMASGTNTFTLTPTDDAVDETNETVTVGGTSGSLTVNSATIAVTDDDDAPTAITLTVNDNSVAENDGATTITVTATVDGTTRFAAATTVTVSVAGSGTATAVDFGAVPSFDITIAAEAASANDTFTLTPTNDVVDETNETVTVSGESGSLTVNSATITLTDDDAAPTAITLTVDDNSVGEGDGATTITVTATVDGTTRFASAATVTVSVAGSGTATAVDFAAVADFDIEIAAGAAGANYTFTLTPTNDAVDETNETVTVGGTSGSLTVNSATITLTDDDATPTAITLTVNDDSVAEDDGATTITVTATVDGGTRFATATTVTVSVAGSGTAGAVDFAAVTDFDITIAAEAASKTGTFTLTPTNDLFDETNETITVSGTSGSLTVNAATITLTDDDDAPTAITLTVDDDSVAEDDGATTITVTATVDGASRFAEATTVTVNVAGSGTATAVDFAAVSDFDITIAAGEASKTGTFTLTPTNDVVDETDETITVSGTSGSLTVNSATITLTDDDATPSITLTVNDDSVGEGDGATTITVTATVDGTTRFAEATTVTVNVAGSGTATAVDFGAVSDFDITIAAEAASANNTFTLTPTNDVVDETNETVTVSGTSGDLTVNSATITLTDDDAAPTAITLTVSDNSVGEGDGATTITVTATVDGTTRFAAGTTVTVSVAGSGTATAVDFAAVSDFDITIAAEAAGANYTFTLTPTNDVVDETDETVTVSGSSGSLTVNSATISLTDNDPAPTSITLTVNDDSVAEGDGATTITVTATVDGTTRFAAGTTVTVSVSGSGTATAVDFAAVSDFDITIAAEAASANDTFALTPTDDALDEADETITVSGTSGSLTVNRDTITLADDDDAPSLSIDSPTVAEGNAGAKDMTFTVTLSAASGQQVTVDYEVDATNPGTATSGTDYAPVLAGTLTFAPSATSETIAVSVTGDTTTEPDETVRLTLSGATNATLGTATGVGTIVSEDGVTLIVVDADPTTPDIEPGPLALNELTTDSANSKSYSVRLKTPPTQTVTVTIASSDADAVTVGDTDSGTPGTQNTLTFTAMNWSAARTVTLTAAQDDDGVGESVTVTHAASTASNSEYTGDSASLTATVDDDETPAVVIDADPSTTNVADAGPLRLTEGHATDAAKTYSVRLATEPRQTVTIALTSDDAGAVSIDDTDGDNTNGVQNTLTFTATTWDTAQTVTARAVDDDDAADESAVLGAAASTAMSSEYTGVTASLTATVDDDETRAVTLSASTLTVPENDSGTYTVQLTSRPVGGNVTVTITGAGSGITTNPTTLTFTPTNWSAAQTVTVSAASDANGIHESVTLAHTASGADYDSGVATAEIVATATDDDGPSLRVSPNTLTVREESSASYQVRLNTQPSANVTVTVGGATTEVTVDTDTDTTGNQSTLTFTTTDWSTYQDVMVSAAADDDATDEMLTLTHGASGAAEYTGLLIGARPGVAVTVDDDDTPAIVIDPGSLALNEQSGHAANAKNYSVRLATQPTAAVSVVITSGDRAVSVDTDSTPRTRTLAFTTTNWSTPQTVTATAADDDDASNERVTIAHAASGGDYGDVTASLVAQTTDDDEPALVVDASALTASGVDEGGMATYTVRLATEPAGTATVAASATGGVSVDLDDAQAGRQSSLRFDAANWNAPRTAVVRGLPDDDAADGMATLRHSASGADYRGVSAPAITFAVADDDTRAVLVAPTALAANEGSTASYTVVLASAPVGGAVAVSATSSDTTAATVSPASLTFTASNWNAPKTFQVRGVADADSTDGTATISHTVSGADYGLISATSVTVEVRDDEAAGVRIEPSRMTLREGTSGVYAVRLNTQPTGDVEVTATAASTLLTIDGDGTPQARTLTFTTENWSASQTVTVAAGDDDDAADETLAVLHAVSGYAGVSSAPSLPVAVEDDDAPGFAFDPAGGLSLSEGGASRTYTVVLTTQPSGTVTVALSSDDAGLAFDTVGGTPGDQTSLTFDATNWNAARMVSVRAVADGDAATEEATLLHAAAGGGYDGVLAGYAVRLSDADAAPAPTGVSAEAAGPTSLTVRWNPSSSQGYLVQWRRAGQSWSASRQLRLAAGSTGARINGLETGVEYRVRVLGLNRGDPGDPSSTARATPATAAGGGDSEPEDLLCAAEATEAPEGGTARIVAELSSASESGERVRWRIVADGDPATADADAGEHGGAAGEVAIPAGGRCAEIEIRIADDADAEPAREWFAVELELRRSEDGSARLRRSRIPVAVLEGVCDRTPAARAALLDAAAVGRGCERPAPADLARIRTLAFDGPGPTALAVGDLGGLSGLRTLDLRGNALTGLAAGVVADVPRLERLRLGGNALAAVPRAALRVLPRLRELDLSDNALATLPARAFQTSDRLRVLRLDGNALRTLPDQAFAGLSLRALRLDGNPGAPFVLTAALERLDGAPWAPPPARIRATVPIGAPFDLTLGLSARGGAFADGSTTAQTLVPAGETTGGVLVVQSDEFAAVSLSVPDLPARRCSGDPCWRGFELAAGVPLALFARQPLALPVPEPAALFGAALRLPLASLVAPGETGGELAWRASSSDPSVATVRIVGGELVLEPEPGAEGTVIVTATATDANGLSATARFEVQVEFHWPSRRAGWRSLLLLD